MLIGDKAAVNRLLKGIRLLSMQNKFEGYLYYTYYTFFFYFKSILTILNIFLNT